MLVTSKFLNKYPKGYIRYSIPIVSAMVVMIYPYIPFYIPLEALMA